MDILQLVDEGVAYATSGITFVRELLTNLAGYLPFMEANLAVAIVFLFASLWAGNFIVDKFVTRPFSMPYIAYTLAISASVFLNLMYL